MLDRAALARRARQDPGWVGRLVSRDGRVGAIVAELSSSDSEVATASYRALQAALAPHERQGFVFHRVGGPVEFVVAGGELETATARMVPVMVLLVGGTLLVLFRSLPAAAASLLLVGLSVLWSMGVHGWLGWPQNSLSQVLPPLLLVIGICDSIHVVARYADQAGDGVATSRDQRRRLLEAIAGDVGGPCTMTSLTTAAGFASFATSELESFARLGMVASFGVMAALLLTFSLLPLLLVRMAPERLRTRSVSERWDRALVRLEAFVGCRPGVILVVSIGLGIVGTAGALRLRVDASFEELYGETSQVVRWAHFVSGHLAPPDRLEVELALPPGSPLEDPANLARIRSVAESLSAAEGLGPARSILDRLSSAPQALERGSSGADAPAAEELAHWVDREHRRVRISVEVEKSPQDQMRRVMGWIDADLRAALPAGWSLETTGSYAVVHDMVDAIRDTQLRSFAIAGLTVFAMVAIFLRSIRYALLAILPTLLPVVVTLGTMGWLGRPLDVGSSMVAAVVIGIAVDDAIHMLDRLQRREKQDALALDAVCQAVRHVGRALITTSFALALAALAISPWESISSFGLLSAVAILGALAADLLVLPALFLRLGHRG